MKTSRIDIASIRKEQIVEAAVAVIAEQGLHNLSLSEIENKAGMKRGQLTYYFKYKEDILLAVFDRVLQLMYQRLGTPPGAHECEGADRSGWEIIRYLLEALLTKPPISPEFLGLQYTFLSQIGYREDFRQRLASLYNDWRTRMAEGIAADRGGRPANRKVPPRAMASLIQGLLHGLTMQLAADPEAFNRREMFDLCLDVLGSYLGKTNSHAAARKPAVKSKPGVSARVKPHNGATLAAKG
jgi:AcrR family transcriptional regulator